MMQNPEFGQVPQTLTSRIEKRREYYQVQGQKTGEAYLEGWRELIDAKDLLAKELGWERYDPTKKVTDSKVMGLIREQKKALRTGDDWVASDEVKEALGVFTEKRAVYRRTKNKLLRHNAELDRWSVFSDYLRKGQWDDSSIDPWLQKEFRKKRPDALSLDVVRFVAGRRQDIGNVEEAPERQTRGFLDRLKNPFRELRKAPAVLAGAADILKTRDGRWDRAQILYAGVSLTSLTLAMLIFTGKIQPPGFFLFQTAPSPRVAQVVSEAPTPQSTPGSRQQFIPENCPYYAEIAAKPDWDPKIVCKAAEIASGNNPALMVRRPDGSFGMGIFQYDSKVFQRDNPELDPLHVQEVIARNPALDIALAYDQYRKYGYASFPPCLDGGINCWREQTAQSFPLVPETPDKYRV
ncbi:hypothetical protein M1437_03475, partial [Patescibacteria group bacterium]|nr:hypothetical protein [Patescibacteria group bacterium]